MIAGWMTANSALLNVSNISISMSRSWILPKHGLALFSIIRNPSLQTSVWCNWNKIIFYWAPVLFPRRYFGLLLLWGKKPPRHPSFNVDSTSKVSVCVHSGGSGRSCDQDGKSACHQRQGFVSAFGRNILVGLYDNTIKTCLVSYSYDTIWILLVNW